MKIVRPLTKRNALEICLELWKWLRDNPTKDKSDWPGWAETILDCLCSCPCCQYLADQYWDIGTEACDQCPLVGFWGGERCENAGSYCERPDTAYMEWVAATRCHSIVKSVEATQKMVDGIEAELKRKDLD